MTKDVSTRITLLRRVKDPDDAAAWREFHALYAPLLFRYARARGLSVADAEEVRDQCLATLSRAMAKFDYDRDKGRFRNWLRRIVNNRVANFVRVHRERIAESHEARALPDPQPSPDDLWEREWRYQHLLHCVEQVRDVVSERSYCAFRMLLVDECPVSEVCARLDMNANQVYVAKSRVLQRVRRKLEELGVGAEV
jgi:RNA polymerase sigma factor (sigma-70 family)